MVGNRIRYDVNSDTRHNGFTKVWPSTQVRRFYGLYTGVCVYLEKALWLFLNPLHPPLAMTAKSYKLTIGSWSMSLP